MLTMFNKLVSNGDQSLHTLAFRNLLENHLPHFRVSPNTTETVMDDITSLDFKSDFHGLLKHLDVPPELWWLTTRVNNLHHPTEYGGSAKPILIPKLQEVEELEKRFLNREKN